MFLIQSPISKTWTKFQFSEAEKALAYVPRLQTVLITPSVELPELIEKPKNEPDQLDKLEQKINGCGWGSYELDTIRIVRQMIQEVRNNK